MKKTSVVLADIHANQFAFEAVVDDIYSLTHQFELICLGDVFGYGPLPVQTYEKIQSRDPQVWLAGNHDLSLEKSYSLDDMNKIATACIRLHRSLAPAALSEKMISKPVKLLRKEILFSHGFPLAEEQESVTAYDYDHDPRQNQNGKAILKLWHDHYPETRLWLMGHSHIQRLWVYGVQQEKWFIFPSSQTADFPCGLEQDLSEKGVKTVKFTFPKGIIDQKDLIIFNPGSVGLPRDGGIDPPSGKAYAKYGLILQNESEFSLIFRSVPYNAESLIALWKRDGYPAVELTRRMQN